MRCLSCHRFTINRFCQECRKRLLTPSISKQKFNKFEIYSFFKYQEIEDLLLTKHTPLGFIVYKALAKITFKPFIKKFIKNYNSSIYIIGVDEIVINGYSHVALLTHQMKMANVKVLHNSLIAQNKIKYSGKSLEFRLKNPRKFIYSGLTNIDVILVDDIITTGTTLKEAKRVLEKNRVNTLFALTLASV